VSCPGQQGFAFGGGGVGELRRDARRHAGDLARPAAGERREPIECFDFLRVFDALKRR